MIPLIVFLAVIASWVPILCGALIWLHRDKEAWKAKYDALRAEADQFYHGHVDLHFQRTSGHPLFGERKEPEESGFKFELGADQVESARIKAIAEMPREPEWEDTEYFTDEDELHIKKLEEVQ